VHDVLLRREVAHGVEVLAVLGPVVDRDAAVLGRAIAEASELGPRGVIVDLSDATEVSSGAMQVLRDARAAAPGWPRPALVVCCSSEEVAAGLASSLPVHGTREDGYAHVDDRSPAHRRRMDLDGSPHCPAAARALAADVVADLHLEPVADDLALVVSELVTNAIRYAQPPVEIEIETTDDEVTVAVADGSPGRPLVKDADDEAEGGRGLTLIDRLAAETGVRPQPPGKTVWAALHRRCTGDDPAVT
jgi:anti-sigma regulatory factor (Ser/Thr protein kinase)